MADLEEAEVVSAEEDLAEVASVVVDLAEEAVVIAVVVRAEELHLVGLELEGPYLVDVEVLIHIIVIIHDVVIIDIGTCHGIEDGGILLIGVAIIVVLFIIHRRIWEAV